jgi:hypothetical protein
MPCECLMPMKLYDHTPVFRWFGWLVCSVVGWFVEWWWRGGERQATPPPTLTPHSLPHSVPLCLLCAVTHPPLSLCSVWTDLTLGRTVGRGDKVETEEAVGEEELRLLVHRGGVPD